MKTGELNRFQRWLIKIGRLRVITATDPNPNIDDDTIDIYMLRYCLWNKSGDKENANLFLHKICRSDQERDLHDHPWNWASLILKGSYQEITENGTVNAVLHPHAFWNHDKYKIFRPFTFRKGKATDTHRLVLINDKPVWSLFWHGKRIQKWGFYVKNEKIYWKVYLNIS